MRNVGRVVKYLRFNIQPQKIIVRDNPAGCNKPAGLFQKKNMKEVLLFYEPARQNHFFTGCPNQIDSSVKTAIVECRYYLPDRSVKSMLFFFPIRGI
jgi:hypothetical protein